MNVTRNELSTLLFVAVVAMLLGAVAGGAAGAFAGRQEARDDALAAVATQTTATATSEATGEASPTARGIVEGDIITSINAQPIDREHPFVNLLYQFRPGDTIDIELYRRGTNETITLQLTLETRTE